MLSTACFREPAARATDEFLAVTLEWTLDHDCGAGKVKPVIASTTEAHLRRCLDGIKFPASRDDLVAILVENQCDTNTIDVLRAMAPGTYTNIRQVLAAASIVDLPPGDDIATRDPSP